MFFLTQLDRLDKERNSNNILITWSNIRSPNCLETFYTLGSMDESRGFQTFLSGPTEVHFTSGTNESKSMQSHTHTHTHTHACTHTHTHTHTHGWRRAPGNNAFPYFLQCAAICFVPFCSLSFFLFFNVNGGTLNWFHHPLMGRENLLLWKSLN